MTDLERIIVLGCAIDKSLEDEGYHVKSVVPWGKVAICVGLDILNSTISDAMKSSTYQANRYRYRRKHF